MRCPIGSSRLGGEIARRRKAALRCARLDDLVPSRRTVGMDRRARGLRAPVRWLSFSHRIGAWRLAGARRTGTDGGFQDGAAVHRSSRYRTAPRCGWGRIATRHQLHAQTRYLVLEVVRPSRGCEGCATPLHRAGGVRSVRGWNRIQRSAVSAIRPSSRSRKRGRSHTGS